MPKLTQRERRSLLDARDEWATLTTIDPDGYPHSVPLGYFRLGDAIYLGTPAHTRKVRNVERNPHVSVVVTPAKATHSWRGVMIQGTATIIRDAKPRLRLERASRRQRGVPAADLPSEPRAGEVFLKVVPSRTISWSVGEP